MLGATAYAGSIGEALTLLEELPHCRPIEPDQEPGPDERAGEALFLRRPVVTADVSSRLLRRLVGSAHRSPSWWPDLDSQLDHVVGCLAAAMLTGDGRILDDSRRWLGTLMASRPGAPDAVPVLWEVLGEVLAESHPAAGRWLQDSGSRTRPLPTAARPAGSDRRRLGG